MRRKTKQTVESVAKNIAKWVGTPLSIVAHTIFFIVIFVLYLFGISIENVMLLLTTIVSLEAIYLSLFIQMTVNQHAESLEDVGQDIYDIQENVEDITEDIDDVQEGVENLETNVKEIAEDVGELETDGDERVDDAKNVIPDSHQSSHAHDTTVLETLSKIQRDMAELTRDVKAMKDSMHGKI